MGAPFNLRELQAAARRRRLVVELQGLALLGAVAAFVVTFALNAVGVARAFGLAV